MIKVKKSDLDHHRKHWEKIAKNNGWYSDPFYIQVWVSNSGDICDSVSFRGINKDLIVDNVTDYLMKEGEYTIE